MICVETPLYPTFLSPLVIETLLLSNLLIFIKILCLYFIKIYWLCWCNRILLLMSLLFLCLMSILWLNFLVRITVLFYYIYTGSLSSSLQNESMTEYLIINPLFQNVYFPLFCSFKIHCMFLGCFSIESFWVQLIIYLRDSCRIKVFHTL